MTQSVFINPAAVEPLVEAYQGMNCGLCDKLQARWRMIRNDEVPGEERELVAICSGCLLYRSPWAEQFRTEIHALSQRVSEARVELGRSPFVWEDQQLLDPQHADAVMSSIYVVSKIRQNRKRP